MSNEAQKPEASEYNALLPQSVELPVDPIDECLEEVSALAAAWQKNRDRKRPSPILRRALITAAESLVKNVRSHEERNKANAEKAPNNSYEGITTG